MNDPAMNEELAAVHQYLYNEAGVEDDDFDDARSDISDYNDGNLLAESEKTNWSKNYEDMNLTPSCLKVFNIDL